MKKYLISLSFILPLCFKAHASECTLEVYNKKTGITSSTVLVAVDSGTKTSLLLAGEIENFGASYEYNAEIGRGIEALNLSNANGDLTSTTFVRDSNRKMSLKLSGKKLYATLACENKLAP